MEGASRRTDSITLSSLEMLATRAMSIYTLRVSRAADGLVNS